MGKFVVCGSVKFERFFLFGICQSWRDYCRHIVGAVSIESECEYRMLFHSKEVVNFEIWWIGISKIFEIFDISKNFWKDIVDSIVLDLIFPFLDIPGSDSGHVLPKFVIPPADTTAVAERDTLAQFECVINAKWVVKCSGGNEKNLSMRDLITGSQDRCDAARWELWIVYGFMALSEVLLHRQQFLF